MGVRITCEQQDLEEYEASAPDSGCAAERGQKKRRNFATIG
jgi:hypothetical protein